MKISRTIIGNTLSNPEFRKCIGKAYDDILAKLYDTKIHFQAHAEAACHAITQVLGDPNATTSEKLKSAALILKGAGVPGFMSGPLVQITQSDNRSYSFEDRVMSVDGAVVEGALPKEEAKELMEGVGLTADWAGEVIEEKMSQPYYPTKTPECESGADRLNELLEPDGSYRQLSIEEEAERDGIVIPKPLPTDIKEDK